MMVPGTKSSLTNRNGKVWQFQFDGANRLTNTIPPSPMQPTSQTFNHQGLVVHHHRPGAVRPPTFITTARAG